MVSAFLLALFLSLFIGFPIFLALIIPSAGFLVSGLGLPPMMVAQRVINGMSKYTLLCIPFFILAATVMGKGKLGDKLLALSRSLVGHIYGGLALTCVGACTIIGAISGAGTAGIITVGPMIVRDMVENGYPKSFALGLITTVSVVAMLIPPSIAFVIYSMVTGTSIARLFLSGVGAGVTFALVFAVYSYIYARRRRIPLAKRPSLRELAASFYDSLWALGLPVIILGGMYSGLFSPTEAAAASAVYAIFVEMFVYREMGLAELYRTCIDTGTTVAMIYVLLGAGSLLAYAMTIAKIPLALQAYLGAASQFTVLVVINIAFLIAGCFVGPGSCIVILMPLFLPIAQAVGIDLIHLGAIVVTNVAIGMFTPPFGLDLFVSCGVFKVEFSYLTRCVLPFILLSLFALALVTYIPAISLWLPNILMK
ncbi:MAG TPA: TRAP transporter large permease [Thermodesulfobacteriota bacterium]|nr:TRAP transporter large permease [Thermodesulfobacteriota bacterium]